MCHSQIYTIWAFVLPLLFNPSEANLGAKTAFIFAGFGILCWVYLYFYQVETAGRSYEELDEMFAKGVSTKEVSGQSLSFLFEHISERAPVHFQGRWFPTPRSCVVVLMKLY